MQIYHIPTTWRGILFDSVLEADWAASMTVWGVDWIHHPGSLWLSDGREWQPDFLLKNAHSYGTDMLLEVKGEHNANADKIDIAREDHPDQLILTGRSPYLRADDLGEYAAAVWEPEDFVWDINGRDDCYVTGRRATVTTPGLKFYKALADSRKVR